MMLLGAVIVQVCVLAARTRPMAVKVWELRGMSALERSARIALGDTYGGFIQFVRDEVPPDAKLVVPAMDVDATFGNVGLMKYLLDHLDIRDCGSGTDDSPCIRSLTGSQSYILRVGDFPQPEDVPLSKEYLPFSDDLGLYVPR